MILVDRVFLLQMYHFTRLGKNIIYCHLYIHEVAKNLDGYLELHKQLTI